ncbi:hypothetical protein SAMN05660642_04647 [Geodermatophilus siccatus]|uniref:DUF4352 domain-containing protein n=1 Tax=Geodermatophilus siccatus TaxID=1137991 RepID=A0A1H0APF4_9ACTN|nr:hypothetical protein [Geodermatophilus siccatus]SDN35408.1 hypothetical protein SAMN05660642_04647 [Geodermatophilus siccatus]
MALVTAGLLAGCGGDDGGDGDQAEPEATEAAGLPEPTSPEEIREGVSAADCENPDVALTQAEWTEFCSPEGPVSEPHQWDNGIAAQVVSVTTEADPEYDNPYNDTHALVTVRFTNNGTAAFDWGGDPNVIMEGGPDGDLLYGANRYPASGYMYDGDNDLPLQLRPGTSADKIFSAYLPGAELGTLAFQVTPVWNGPMTPWTFTDVQTLLTDAPPPRPADECIGYGCSPEQDEAINEAEREANAGN